MTATYLDHAASTPMRPEAIEAMGPYLDVLYANPSGSHRFARRARQAIDEARDRVAAVLGCRPDEVVFTGSGTEGDNMAVAGAIRAARHAGRAGVAVCPAVEHHAVLDVVEHDERGHVVAVDAAGRVDLDSLAMTLDQLSALGDPADVVSVMAVNNEVGTITDLDEVARVVRRHAPTAWFHTDAVQAASWVDWADVTPHVDLVALSAHKFGGPKGVGILVERGRAAAERVAPIIVGGGQERERRSGTQNVAGIVAAAEALAITADEREAEIVRVGALRDALVDRLAESVDDMIETVPRHLKSAGNAHVCILGIESEALLFLLDEADVCASAASACASGAMEPSHVLAAMGVDRSHALGALRLSVGHTTTSADVDRAVEVIGGAVERLRRRATARKWVAT